MNQVTQPENPENTTQLLTEAINKADYNSFENLLSENGKKEIGKNDFEEIQNIYETGYRTENFNVITFSNGEVLLVLLDPKGENNQVLIRKIIRVSEENKPIFKTWE